MSLDPKFDLVLARVAGEQIDDYVHAEVLYYPIGAVSGMQIPPLTIGGWLETQWRLKAIAARLTPAQQAVVTEAQARIQRVRSRVPEMYQQKARREFKSHLDTWTWYLDDVLSREPTSIPPEGQAYATQVHVRVKLQLLGADVPQLPDQQSRLTSADQRLRSHFTTLPFLWDAELQPAAPASEYWFLYGRPA